jgi:hypothetical protein
MNVFRSLLLLAAASALLAAGCKDSPTDADSKSLLVRSWKTVTVTAGGLDASQEFADVTTFHDDGTYDATFTSSPSKSGTWQITGNGKQLVMDPGTSVQGVWTILELTSMKLHMTAQLNILGTPVGFEYTGVPN